MAKRRGSRQPRQQVRAAPEPQGGSANASWQRLLLAMLALGLYANTLAHGYAYDDGVALLENSFVQKGLAGIPDILGNDAFASYYESLGADPNQLPGGRYRPLSTITFAVEQGLIGDHPAERHFVNVALYGAGVVALFGLLRRLAPRHPLASFLAALLFAVHPIHSEAVANVKGRDELLSFLFLTVALVFALRHDATQRPLDRVVSLAAYGLGLLSKEYGLTLVALLPLVFLLHRRRPVLGCFRASLGHMAVAAAYVVLRVSITGASLARSNEVLSNPYLYATATQALATKIEVLARYLRLLVWPHPLACDYSFRQIPYVDFANLFVWLSILLHAGLVAAGVVLLRRRHVLAFAVFFYLGNLLLVSNLIVDIGAPMGERLVFHSSAGFAMLVAWPLAAAFEHSARGARTALWAAVVLVAVAAGALTVDRNRDWRDDATLFGADVQVVPDSVAVRANAATALIRKAERHAASPERTRLLQAALGHLDHALALHPTFLDAWLSRGLARFDLGELDLAEVDWRRASELYGSHPMVRNNLRALAQEYYRLGLDVGEAKRYAEARAWFEKAVALAPDDPGMWSNLGKASYWLGDKERARESWSRALALDPGRRDAASGLKALNGSGGS